MIRWDPSINLGTLLIGVPLIFMLAKIYGDWRVMKVRIDLMWIDYCRQHHIIVDETGREIVILK